MIKTELLELIANGENSGIEFKRDDIRPEQLAKEIVAMANFQGGIVLLGVEDDGTISGLTRPNAEEWVMNVIRDKIHPLILPFYQEIKTDENVFVAIITFPQGISKPYVLRDKGEEKIFIRVGSTSQLATREQQMRLFEVGGINALAHRDWTRFLEIEVGIYSDRMEFISPGTLQNSMTIEKMVLGQRSPRNPIIMEVLRDYGYVDSRGMGVRTKIIPLMRKFNHSEPVFKLTEDYLKTTLYRKVPA